MVFTRSAKKALQANNSRKLQRIVGGKSENFWFCVGFLALVVCMGALSVLSIKRSNEKFIKSDYYLQMNNLLYGVQQENGTALLVTFTPKFLRGNKKPLDLWPEVFDNARKLSKITPDVLYYEVLRTNNRNEVLVQLKLRNQSEYD